MYNESLWTEAARLRREYWGRQVFLRGIIEFSNYCRQNCHYCGLRRDNTALPRYRLDADTIVACAGQIKRLGIGTVVLQSGEDPAWSGHEFAVILRRIKQLGLAVTLSLGERDPDDYARWREAGADRYLLKFETSDPVLYARLRPGCRLEDRLACLEVLRQLDYETGSGMIVGLPDAPPDATADLHLLATVRPDMISVSPFIPHPDTPLRDCPACEPQSALRAMAAVRHALPQAHLPVTSALSLQGDALRLQALEVADVIMPSLTPEDVREAYTIYPGKNQHADSPEQRAQALRELLVQAGFVVPDGPGSAWRKL